MAHDSPWVPKHGPRPAGQQLCAYSPTGHEQDYCHKPATWHVMWDGDLDNSFTCDQHMDLIQQRWMYDDRHPVVADCGMPGALWMYKLNCCEFPSDPAETVSAREDVTAGATTSRSASRLVSGSRPTAPRHPAAP